MNNVEEYLKKIISNINKASDLHIVAKIIDDDLVNSFGYVRNDTRKEKIYNILFQCQNNMIDDNTLVELLKNIDNVQDTPTFTSSNSSNAYSSSTIQDDSDVSQKESQKEDASINDNTKKESSTIIESDNNNVTQGTNQETTTTTSYEASSVKSQKKSNTKEPPIIDVDTEVINDVSKDYGEIENLVSDTKITISNSEIQEAAGDLTSVVEKGKADIEKDLNSLKEQMVESVSAIEYVDEDIEPADIKDFDFNDIWKYTGKLKASGVKIADKEFFEKCGYTVDGDTVTVGEYQYNIKNQKFFINGKAIGKAYFYIPTGASDYSKLNTLTLLCQGSRKQDVGSSSNSIIIALDNGDSSYLRNPSNVAGVTKFMNQVAKTDLNKCQNIITGGSRFGARSLKIAAESGDLYQTVICVNNAAIVKGVNGGNGSAKEVFESLEQLRKLNGKNIYFVSSKDDPNLTMLYKKNSPKGEIARDNDVTKCYVYTGINLLIDNCPDSSIYFITNNDDPAFANISSPNYVYGRDLWNQVANSEDYAIHGTLHNILNDMCSSNLVGYNAYNSGGTNMA